MSSRLLKVFLANRGLISSVLRRYSIRHLDLEDLTQETILRALEAEKRTEIQEPKRFLVGVAKNVARSELERRAKFTAGLLDDLDPESYVSDEPAVDEIVDARRRIEVFGKAVAMLPPQCQKAFLLKHVYGASHKAIAEKLGIAVSTVEKHVALGLRRCREAMLQEQSAAGTGGDESDESVLGLERRRR